MSLELELLKHVFRKPFTLLYPFEKRELPKGFRGRIEYDMGKCIGCGLCARDCPSGAIEMVGRGRTAEFKVHLYMCTFCGQCVDSCPVNAISFTNEYEYASRDKSKLVFEFKRPVEGVKT
ncbi:MAG: NADH-quinone oxidoreductase subunit I [Candidatus Bathyarchaeia archaeon]